MLVFIQVLVIFANLQLNFIVEILERLLMTMRLLLAAGVHVLVAATVLLLVVELHLLLLVKLLLLKKCLQVFLTVLVFDVNFVVVVLLFLTLCLRQVMPLPSILHHLIIVVILVLIVLQILLLKDLLKLSNLITIKLEAFLLSSGNQIWMDQVGVQGSLAILFLLLVVVAVQATSFIMLLLSNDVGHLPSNLVIILLIIHIFMVFLAMQAIVFLFIDFLLVNIFLVFFKVTDMVLMVHLLHLLHKLTFATGIDFFGGSDRVFEVDRDFILSFFTLQLVIKAIVERISLIFILIIVVLVAVRLFIRAVSAAPVTHLVSFVILVELEMVQISTELPVVLVVVGLLLEPIRQDVLKHLLVLVVQLVAVSVTTEVPLRGG